MNDCYWRYSGTRYKIHCSDLEKAKQIAIWSKCELGSVYEKNGRIIAIDVMVTEKLLEKALNLLEIEKCPDSISKSEIPIIDLKNRYGKKYKIRFDKSAADMPDPDLMYQIIPCRYGEIYAYDHEYLAAMANSMRIANEMRSWPELEIILDAGDAVIFKFHVDHFDKVAQKIKARQKYSISDAERERRSRQSKIALKNTNFRHNNSRNQSATASKFGNSPTRWKS